MSGCQCAWGADNSMSQASEPYSHADGSEDGECLCWVKGMESNETVQRRERKTSSKERANAFPTAEVPHVPSYGGEQRGSLCRLDHQPQGPRPLESNP